MLELCSLTGCLAITWPLTVSNCDNYAGVLVCRPCHCCADVGKPDECPTPPSARMGRYGSWDGGSESSGLSPMGLSSGTPPINRCASPIFPPLQNPPSLPPRPASPSPQRANTNLPPAIPPRPDLCATDSVNGRGPHGIATLATSPLRSLPSHMPPPVSPRSAASLPVNHSSIHGGSSPLFPRQSYENTNLPSRLR
eukprot:scpid83316/ scgid3459/ 